MGKITPEKIRRALAELADATHEHRTTCPALVHSDGQKLADAKLLSAYQEARAVLAQVDEQDKDALREAFNRKQAAAFGGKAGR